MDKRISQTTNLEKALKFLGNYKFYSHLSSKESERFTNKKIRQSVAKSISSYHELIEELAKTAYFNPGYSFFYRGQEKDHSISNLKPKEPKLTSMYPTIFRTSGSRLTSLVLEQRYKKLYLATKIITKEFKVKRFSSYKRMEKFPELAWSVLQHYNVCRTPLIDVTHSARVASSFALPEGNSEPSGYFYVLALPHIVEGLGYSVDNELVTLKLLNVCPPQAKRPFFQEGYLIGNFPYQMKNKQPSYDLAGRLIAKYKLNKKMRSSKDFPLIPNRSLAPDDDQVSEICNRIKMEIEAQI